MKGFFSGWDFIDAVAMILLLVVMASFALCCLPRFTHKNEFFSIRLVLAFLTFTLYAGAAWFKMEAVMDHLHWMETPRFPLSERTFVDQAHERLAGGFFLLAIMGAIHSGLWFAKRKNVSHIK